MPARCEKRAEGRADQPCASRHQNLHAWPSFIEGVCPDVVPCDVVPIAKCPRKFASHVTPTKYSAQRPERQRVLDVIVQHARPLGQGRDSMRVLELSKRSAHLHVLKLSPRHATAMLGDPTFLDRTDANLNLDPRSVSDPSRVRQHLELLPGRRQSLERPRPRVPVKHGLGRRGKSDLLLKDFHETGFLGMRPGGWGRRFDAPSELEPR